MSAKSTALLVAGLLLFCLVAGVGLTAYNMGMMQALGSDYGRYYAPAPAPVPAPAPAPAPYPYYGPRAFRPFGWSLFGCLGPLLGLFLLFALIRCFVRPWRWHGHYGRWGGGNSPFDEWHRRAHAGETPPQTGGPAPNPPTPQASDR